jgi:hypothetical protein
MMIEEKDIRAMLTQYQLERARRRWNKPVQREAGNPAFIEEKVCSYSDCISKEKDDCLMTGNYMIINGRKMPIEIYGEIIAEDIEE